MKAISIRRKGELDGEHGAAFGAIVACDPSAVILDDAVTDTEAESRAFAGRLRSKEGVEHVLRGFDSWSRVREFNYGSRINVPRAGHPLSPVDLFERIHGGAR